MTGPIRLFNRLTAQILFFLTLALLPLGVVSLLQNQQLRETAADRSQLSLLALTETAASGERQLIQRTFGAAKALGETIDWISGDPASCRGYLNRFQQVNETYAFVGFIDAGGRSVCSTATEVLDFSGYPNFADLMANPRRNIEVNTNAPGSGQSVMILNEPYVQDGQFQGYVSISLPLKDVGKTPDFLGDADPISLVTFNADGQLLSTENGRNRARGTLPLSPDLKAIATGESRTFVARSIAGDTLAYSVVPIVPDVVYALGTWRAARLASEARDQRLWTVALPVLMWLASLFVAWVVLDRFVLSRIKVLNRAMYAFATNRIIPPALADTTANSDLREVEENFRRMAETVLQDEAEQEDRLREKSVLLKEVHHRVKNNLQIISSIMNMQIRKADAAETKTALSQVQDRIMGLSGVHRLLYQAENLTQINAATLIERVTEQSVSIAGQSGTPIRTILDLDPVIVFPDQAVPLTMLLSEAITNALKYIGGDTPTLTVKLTLQDKTTAPSDGIMATLVIANTLPATPVENEENSTGLGAQLMRAFATQLNGQLDTDTQGGTYTITVTFTVEEFRPDAQDY
ncbi:sensor histidine kinase [Nereida sp. MMG025]|uniref:sensor histidine kinase n=1 Tax=Nereida sp. MMG025 TaxID=2909981 RepID=UPI001F410FE3|nr:sensor histidine kinase [Nereida sp. MMG025]MCF6445854.1 sensor histidine kinase [Nereida sp. MMG025]